MPRAKNQESIDLSLGLYAALRWYGNITHLSSMNVIGGVPACSKVINSFLAP